jgi:hypothetical protein
VIGWNPALTAEAAAARALAPTIAIEGVIGQCKRISHDVGQFFANFGQLRRMIGQRPRLFRREPLKMLHQLGGFNRQRHRDVFRRMELRPIPLSHKISDDLAQLGNGRIGIKTGRRRHASS